MIDLFLPAGFLDGVIAFTLLEFAYLAWRHRRSGRGLGPRDLASGLAPGLGLMLALRLADLPQVPLASVLALAIAGLAHAWDFRRRFALADAQQWPSAGVKVGELANKS
ncbi:MAG: hypothetical protein WCK08_12585 [Betaproteobacteria bacterium]